MPKQQKRKRTTDRSAGGNVVVPEPGMDEASTRVAPRLFMSAGSQNLQNLVFSVMVALGCWGMAIFFAFLDPDANHILYGGIMALTALGWSVIAARKWSSYRQRA